MKKDDKIFVAGHRGLVGSAVLRKLKEKGYTNIITKSHKELDLTNQAQTEAFFEKERPDYVFLAAAKVGGIIANQTYPAEFIYKNLTIATNVVNSCYKYGVKKLLNMGSSCIYPKFAPQPMKEEALLSGKLETTNEAYALAKICAIELCKHYNNQYGTNYISVMPTNQYGEGDNFNMQTAHLLPMLMRRFHLAKLLEHNDFETIRKDLKKYKLGWGIDEKLDINSDDSIKECLSEIGAYSNKVVVWGDGSPLREMMSSDDLADACVYLMENKDSKDVGEFVNITDGTDIAIKDLILLVKDIVGFGGELIYDKTKPNGTPRKLMDATKIKALGWSPKIDLREGITHAYKWYQKSIEN